MKLFILIAIIFFMLSESINGLGMGQCTKFLSLYYNCIDGSYTKDRNTALNDAYYNSTLAGINSFTQAMDLFSSLFTSLKSCNSNKCRCVKNDVVYLNSFYRFFTSSYLYPQMVSIKSTIKKKYNLLPIAQISNTSMFQTPLGKYASLNGFCLKYEYDSAINYFYSELRSCYNNLTSNPRYPIDCYTTYVSMDLYSNSRNSKDQFEKYFACVAGLFRTCETSIRRSILFDFFSSVPTFINNDKTTNLTTYIDYLYTLNYVPGLYRNATSLDNLNINSLNKGQVACSTFKKSQTYTLLDSSSLKVTETFKPSGNSLKLVFMYNSKLNYTFSLPGSYSNKISVQDPNKNNWIDIKYEEINKNNYYIITDYKTNSTIKTNECTVATGCSIYLVSPYQLYKGATGNLITGCP